MANGAPPTDAQAARAERSVAIFRRRGVPSGAEPLFVEDDGRVALREPGEVARRALVLLSVVKRADAAPRDMVLKRVSKLGLWDSVSPAERRFLQCDVPDEQQSRRLVWRLEAVWALMWALGHVEDLAWPARRCDVPRLGKMMDVGARAARLIREARLRPSSEILDALDVAMRLHRVLDDARGAGRPVPENLDWTQPGAMRPVDDCPASRVVHQRRRALLWLTRFQDAGWDDVETEGAS